MKDKLLVARDAVSAGLLIALVSYCYIMCADIKYVGAVLFAFGLVIICKYGLKLFTGMAGYINKGNIADFLIAVVVNCLTAWLVGAVASMNATVRERTLAVCETKFSVSYPWLFISAVLCGIMIYLGVDFFRKHGSLVGIYFAIPIFVLSGFDHTVADMFYIGASGRLPDNFIIVLPIMIIGNAAGSNLIRALMYKKSA